MKQVWNWFTNRRHALRAKAKYPRMLNVSPIAWDDSNAVRNAPQAPQSVTAPVNPSLYVSLMPWDDPTAARNVHQTPKSITAPAVQSAGRTISDKYLMEFEAKSARDGAILPSLSFSAVQSPGITISDKYHMEFEAKSARDGAILPSLSFSALQSPGRTVSDKYHMEFEAKSARDGAWYDVAMFMSHRSLKTGDADVLVRFAGLGPEEDEWVNIHRHVRPRSLPCEPSECAAVLPGDLILCFQEGQEQGRYFDAHILDVRKRRHDLRGCRCRFRVRYDHDQSEEIVPLRKICRRPETDYRFRQLRGIKKSGSVNRQKIGADAHTGDTLRAYSSTEPMQKQQKVEEHADAAAMVLPPGNVPIAMEPEVQPKITEISTSDNVVTSMVPPANVAVTSGDAANTITGGSMVPPANVVVTNGDATNTITGGSGQVGTSMVPPANVVVTSVDAANTIAGGSGPTS